MSGISHKVVKLSVSDYIGGYRDACRFMEYCKECGNYGTVWVCPPYAFDPLGRIQKYTDVHIVGTKIEIDEATRYAPTDGDHQKNLSYRILQDVRKELDGRLLEIEKLYPDSLAFFAGSCFLCRKEDCTRRLGKPCLYPDRTRSSLEAYGFDIGKTTSELLGIEIRWGDELILPEYFTLVSGMFTNHEIDHLEWE